jgi:hypothetical protein
MKMGYKIAQPEVNRDQRVKRAIILGNALDALEDIPVQEEGRKFLKNDWHMGPFYSWNKNY